MLQRRSDPHGALFCVTKSFIFLQLSNFFLTFAIFFHLDDAGRFLDNVPAAKVCGRRGREAASARGEVPVPRVRAEDGGRPKRELAVSAEGKSANFTDLVKMPIPFCTLSCYTAYIKASERSTDHDRNEPQC